jgi:hypothetical protein
MEGEDVAVGACLSPGEGRQDRRERGDGGGARQLASRFVSSPCAAQAVLAWACGARREAAQHARPGLYCSGPTKRARPAQPFTAQQTAR